MGKVFFTADLHFGHKNIMKHVPKRYDLACSWARSHGVIITKDNIIDCMDQWLIEKWNSQVSKKDTVYILGDFSFYNAEYNKVLLGKLNGKKFLITGNHDGNSDNLSNYFEQITQIKEYKFKPDGMDTVCFEMCHFPMSSWNRKEHGSLHIHGHCHNNSSRFNYASQELKVDIGIDGDLAKYRLLTDMDIYNFFKKLAGSDDFEAYTESIRKQSWIRRAIKFIVRLKGYDDFKKRI